MAAPPSFHPPPAGVVPDVFSARMQKLSILASTYEIRGDWLERLRALEGFEIAFICDDSGSMGTPVAPGGGARRAAGAFGRQPTRWDELRHTASVIVELATAATARGVDVYFLNRPPVLGVTQAAQIQAAFDYAPPQGFTPLTRTFKGVLEAKRASERPLLIVIATDGEPTDDTQRPNVGAFIAALQAKPARAHVQLMACTDDDAAISWMARVDRVVPRVDVTDDYASERLEVLSAQGAGYHFTYGDYVVKSLLGSIDPYFDRLDEHACCAVA